MRRHVRAPRRSARRTQTGRGRISSAWSRCRGNPPRQIRLARVGSVSRDGSLSRRRNCISGSAENRSSTQTLSVAAHPQRSAKDRKGRSSTATRPAMLSLTERSSIRFMEPVSRYWPGVLSSSARRLITASRSGTYCTSSRISGGRYWSQKQLGVFPCVADVDDRVEYHASHFRRHMREQRALAGLPRADHQDYRNRASQARQSPLDVALSDSSSLLKNRSLLHNSGELTRDRKVSTRGPFCCA